ncbi:hypothetical protein J7E45_09420 [Microbacterium sp. ISL-59]|uniref:DUF7507 domain-containing protein n=1 Tax=Microbacterium sp. ISL-59 TaxID=2819159 RepID=UPI001BE97618|nr:hypothetical protein [Microbacterium sp. ISL-59]MBT2495827.1 hypothetical protein [Microbacterium sp. ISL-59]
MKTIQQFSTGTAHSRGHSRSRAALSVLIASMAILTAVAVPGGSAIAVEPGYASASNWIAQQRTSFATLPGGLGDAGQMTAVSSDPNHQTISLVEGPGGRTDLNVTSKFQADELQGRPCVNAAPIGTPVECFTEAMTVTLPAPVVDPVVQLSMRGGARTEPGACVESFMDARFSAINGAPAAAEQLSEITSASNWALVGTELRTQTQPGNCTVPDGGGPVEIQLKGLITSFTLDTIYGATVVATNGAIAFPRPVGMTMNVAVATNDLQLTAAGPSLLPMGGTAEWTYDLTNAGTNASYGYIVTEVIPSSVSNPELVSGDGCSISGNTLTCAVAPEDCTIAPNATSATYADLTCASAAIAPVLTSGASAAPIVIRGTVTAGRGEAVEHTATAASATADVDTTTNTVVASTTVQTVGLKYDVTADRVNVRGAGETIDFTYTMTNIGTATLEELTIDTIDFTGTGEAPAETCDTSNLSPGASMTCHARYTTTVADAEAGSVTLTSAVTSLPAGESTTFTSDQATAAIEIDAETGNPGPGGPGPGGPGPGNPGTGTPGGSGNSSAEGADGALAATGTDVPLPLLLLAGLLVLAGGSTGVIVALRRRAASTE